jgi:hypothetical protein
MGSAEWGVDSTTVTTDIDGLFSGVLPGLKAHGWVGARAPFPSLAGLAAPAQLALLCPDFLVLNWGRVSFGSPEWRRLNCSGGAGAAPPMSTWVGILFILFVLFFPDFLLVWTSGFTGLTFGCFALDFAARLDFRRLFCSRETAVMSSRLRVGS